jgi:hypothetical protein
MHRVCRYDIIPYVWERYRLSPGTSISCQSFEGVNKHVKDNLANHSNYHFNPGLRDNCLANALYRLYESKELCQRCAEPPKEETCNNCTSCTSGRGETPGKKGRCERYPKCKEVKHVLPHSRFSCLDCPHNGRYRLHYSGPQ